MNKEFFPRILFEDTDILVVDKPSGLMAHGDGRSKEKTLVDWLLTERPALEGIGEPLVLGEEKEIKRPGIVHRLDKETSGVMIIAKTQKSFEHLKSQFMERKILKIYRAFVLGRIKDERGSITRPIGKSRSDFRQWSAGRNPRGAMREARTDFHTLLAGDAASYLEVFPKTGRTHQIRVHLKAIHHPVVCDSLYGPKNSCILGFTRLALHALSLTVMLPRGYEKTFSAPLPAEFLNAEKALRKKE